MSRFGMLTSVRRVRGSDPSDGLGPNVSWEGPVVSRLMKQYEDFCNAFLCGFDKVWVSENQEYLMQGFDRKSPRLQHFAVN